MNIDKLNIYDPFTLKMLQFKLKLCKDNESDEAKQLKTNIKIIKRKLKLHEIEKELIESNWIKRQQKQKENQI